MSISITGLIFLLYGITIGRIAMLTINDVEVTGQGMFLSLGRYLAPVPELPAPMFWAHLKDRAGRQMVNRDTRRLFPGVRAGAPRSPNTHLLKLRGMGANVQGIRNTTLQSLVKEIGATSLARRLGYSKQTLSRHAGAAGALMSSYVVDRNPASPKSAVATNLRMKPSDKAPAHVYAPISFHLRGDSMRHSRLWQNSFFVLFLGLLTTSCASGPVGKTGPDVTTPSPTVSTPPVATCASFLPSAPCSQYVSISGTSNGVTLPWVSAGGLRVELYSVNGGLQFAAKTPCNPISGPAAITGNTLTLGKLAVGAMGCAGESSAQEHWVMQFLNRPIEMSFVQDTLTWTNGADTLSFKSK